MEASSTTLNINAPATPAEPPKHNHKANFGRYAPGCPKCIEVHPNGPPARKTKVQKAPTLTREQIMEMLREATPQAMAAAPANGDTLQQLVQLMLAKEGKILQKEATEAVQREVARQDMIRVTAEHHAMIANNQARCGHVKDNGRTAINGQVHNDGKFHPFCQRCFKEFTPYAPSGEQISNGIQI